MELLWIYLSAALNLSRLPAGWSEVVGGIQLDRLCGSLQGLLVALTTSKSCFIFPTFSFFSFDCLFFHFSAECLCIHHLDEAPCRREEIRDKIGVPRTRRKISSLFFLPLLRILLWLKSLEVPPQLNHLT